MKILNGEAYQFYREWNKEKDLIDNKQIFMLLAFPHNANVRNRSVTALCWNPSYEDLFAVGYGSYNFPKKRDEKSDENNEKSDDTLEHGYIYVFSVKNNYYPEVRYTTDSGVLCLDFHPVQFSLEPNPSDCLKHRYFAILLFSFWASISFGQESPQRPLWSNIRGPQLNGHANGNTIVDHVPKEGPPVLWTRELGQGYSSFIAWDQVVATQYQDIGGQYVVCLDADSGTTQWQYRYDWPYDPAGVYPGPRSTPTFDQGRVYFTSPSGLLGCLSAESGALIWSVDLAKTFQVDMPGFGYACSPIVVDDKIILPVGAQNASLVAFSKTDGSVRWKSADVKPVDTIPKIKPRESRASYCSVYPIQFQGDSCIVGYLENELICCDTESGALVWHHSLSSGYDEHSAWPIYDEPYLWITGAFQRGSELLQITGEKSPAIKTIRQSKWMSNDIFSSVLYKGALFGFDLQEAQAKTHRTSRGIFRCIDFLSGEVLWSVGSGRIQRAPASGSEDSGIVTRDQPHELLVGHATVLVADGKLVLMNDMGELILAKATREKYEELWRTPLLQGEICWTQPAIANSRLFARNQSRSVCVYLGPPESLSAALRDKTLTIDQLPRVQFRDLASVLLGVEPEYLFDLPSVAWLWKWYWISLLGAIACPFVSVHLVSAIYSSSAGHSSKTTRTLSTSSIAFSSIAFVLGAIGTTYLSRWTSEFIFTWHVCLYVAWHMVVLNLSKKTDKRSNYQRAISTIAALFFLACCIGYFLLCRRLSLVFEWVFLAGFFAALPFNLAAKHWHASGRWELVWQFAVTCLGFSAYYWASAAIILLKSS